MQLPDKKHSIEKAQKIYFDDLGNIILSCDTIFPIQAFLNKNIRTIFPLVDSIFDDIFRFRKVALPFQIQRVKTTFPHLQGFYDFVFEKKEVNETTLNLLTIQDCTKFYRRLRQEMQKENEAELKKRQ
jgi:hypothetical protein